MLKIGLTGGIGCGKSTAVNAFRALGAAIIDADQISKNLVKAGTPALAEIAKIFGEKILLPNGELNRESLKKAIFSDSKSMEQLEAIIHPGVRAEINQQIAMLSGYPYVIVDIPLLVEKSYAAMFDRIVVIDCLPKQQLERVSQRDKLDVTMIEAIIKKQASREARLKKATDVIDNSKDINTLEAQVKNLHDKFIMN